MDRRNVLEFFVKQKEFMNERVSCGIEHYRKGDATIRVIDKNGNPINNVVIKAKQKNHEFRFGASIFLLDELESKEKNEIYKKAFLDVFNMATLPFYWDATEPKPGQTRYDIDSPKMYRRPAIDLCMEFCQKHGIEPREHALAYEGFFPPWIWDASVDEIKDKLEKRFIEISSRYKDKINTIEVTNEMYWPKGRSAFYEDPDYVLWCFKLAEKYFPNNQLCINEYTPLAWEEDCSTTDKYYSYIKDNLNKGARIDAIGMQYHLFNKPEEEYEKTRLTLNPENLYKHLDLYASFGKPIQITEVTAPAYSWNPEDEEIQAQMIEYLYSIWFSHPNVEQIIYWNLVDGYAFVLEEDPEKIRKTQGDMTLGENIYYGGLLRFDLSPKPAYFKIKELIKERWHTNTEVVTSTNGVATFRGFYGKYDLEIFIDGKLVNKEISLSKKANNEFVIEI